MLNGTRSVVVLMAVAAAAAGACSDFKGSNAGPSGETDASIADGAGPTDATTNDATPADDGSKSADATPDVIVADAGVDVRVDAGASRVCTEMVCPPDVVETGLYAPVALAVNGTHIYWLEVGTHIPQNNMWGEFVRIPKAMPCKDRSCFDVLDYFVLGGQLEGQNIYDALLAIGPTDVCYSQSFNTNAQHSIYCYALSSPTKRSLNSGAGDVVDLWVGAGSARWVTAEGAVLSAALADGGAPTVIADKRPTPTAVTSDGNMTYWSEYGSASAEGGVNASDDDGGARRLATGTSSLGVRLHGDHVYWLNRVGRTVMRARTDGTGMPEQIATTDENPSVLAVDASGVYWASMGGGPNYLTGSVAHCPHAPGGPTTVMVTNLQLVQALALDTDYVYAASAGVQFADGKIVRIKKTY